MIVALQSNNEQILKISSSWRAGLAQCSVSGGAVKTTVLTSLSICSFPTHFLMFSLSRNNAPDVKTTFKQYKYYDRVEKNCIRSI